ncbi:hypothetical protein HK405_002271, partial [Cladochytrium tenue]
PVAFVAFYLDANALDLRLVTTTGTRAHAWRPANRLRPPILLSRSSPLPAAHPPPLNLFARPPSVVTSSGVALNGPAVTLASAVARE